MEAVRQPTFKVTYNGKNISEDLGKYLLSIRYTDKEEGESDELEIQLEDTEALWRGPWYPDKGATIEVSMGYADKMLRCGVFDIDEIELAGPPDVVTIKGLAAGIKKAIRTKRSRAHEKKTLRSIANTVAASHGFTVTGTIPDVTFERITQHKKNDLHFLRELGYEYGCIFSIRGNKMVFSIFDELEARKASTSIDRADISTYSFKDKTSETYQDAKVAYHNPKTKAVVSTEYKTTQEQNADQFAYTQIVPTDTKMIYTKAENKKQAELKARASLHRANSNQQEGTIGIEGNPLIVAGNNFDITGMGKLSGVWHITSSTHSIVKSEGYKTEAKIKRVQVSSSAGQASKKAAKKATATVTNAKVITEQNKDGFTYSQIKQ